MAKRRSRRTQGAKRRRGAKRRQKKVTVVHPDAAGIDVGSEQHLVAVPEDRDEPNVRSFGCFTADLHELADWLQECGVTTVAMESTGVYWIPLFEILEQRGFEVLLVNARHVKNVPGRPKTDVADCQWLCRLHMFGLLTGSFRPADAFCELRAYVRHRDNLVKQSSAHIQRMQKALTQMNVQLHKVITDITGVTGLRIIDAILEGERDPEKLAALRDPRTRKSPEVIAKALEGNYRDEHLFALRHERELYTVMQDKIAECEAAIVQVLHSFEASVDLEAEPLPPPTTRNTRDNPELREALYRIAGVDFTRIPGLSAMTVLVLISELGLDMSKWPSVKNFASWLRLCPGNDVTGGKVIRRGTKPGTNRASNAFRMAAQATARTETAIGGFYRRKKSALGAPKANTATAHKIARTFYQLAKTGHEYVDPGLEAYERDYQARILRNLRRRAHALGYDLVENADAA